MNVIVILAILATIVSCERHRFSNRKAKMRRAAPHAAEAEQVNFEGESMGSTWHVAVVMPAMSPDDYEEMRKSIAGLIDQVDREMSVFRPDSELSRFNGLASTEPFPVSEDTIKVVRKALEIADLSGGAFDPTVRPLVELWGFGASKREKGAPPEEELEKAARLVDYRNVIADVKSRTLRKKAPGASLDLNAIAPGYAVDKVFGFLASQGYTDYMVEVGGEVRTQGKNRTGGLWKVGIDKPVYGTAEGEDMQVVIGLSGQAIATSGVYRKYREVDGKRVSHEIDPKLRGPIRHNLASVSIVAASCMDADGYSTAVEVLGPERGMEFVKRLNGVEAYMILAKSGGGFEVRMTEGFEKLIQK